jgi:hypothetical protein
MPRSTDALRNPISVKKLAVPIVLKTAVITAVWCGYCGTCGAGSIRGWSNYRGYPIKVAYEGFFDYSKTVTITVEKYPTMYDFFLSFSPQYSC